MEAVPRLFMISCELKVSPSNTEFGPTLKKYIKDHYHEDCELYAKEIKELETLRQTAIKAPMDFTGCSILKRYYSQLHMLQSRFPMTDDGAACVPFMWTDIYSGVAYNITDIEYEEACILYNIGALHSKLGTMDSRINAEGMKIGCTHFQCAAWAFQHLRDTYPQPKGSDMSHDLLSFFINVMLAQAQECILEKSMLDSRKSSITAKIAAQVVDYYKCALSKMVKGSPSAGGFFGIVGSKTFTSWKKSLEFKVSYYLSISHLFMGNQSEEHEKWGERVAWFQSALDHLMEASKMAKNMSREDLNEPLTFMMDVIGGKHNSAKKENEFVYHEKVPATESLQELKGASLVKGIPFSPTDPDVSGPDIFARLVPMEAHETSSLYSEEKAKILRSTATKVEKKNEELMAYLSSLQLDSSISLEEEEKIPQELLEKCAAMSVQPTAISDLTELMNVLMSVSRDVELALKSCNALLKEEELKEQKYQENFGKRVPSMIIVELTKECSKYEEAHKKAVESNKTLQSAVNIHIGNLSKLSSPLEEVAKMLPSISIIKNPENVKTMQEFNQILSKVDEMKNQRQYIEQQLRDSLLGDDITKHLIALDKKEDLQKTFANELKKHDQLLTYLDQNLAAQDNILCALTQANARIADTRKAIIEIKQDRDRTVHSLINSHEAYEDLISKATTGLEFYQKLQTNSNRLLSRIRSVTKVQDEERVQITEVELRKANRFPPNLGDMPEMHVPKLKEYLPYLSKKGPYETPRPPGSSTFTPIHQYPNLPATMQQPIAPRQLPKSAAGLIPAEFNRNLKPVSGEPARPLDDVSDLPSMGVRPAPLGSEHTSLPTMCSSGLQYNGMPDLKQMSQYAVAQSWKQPVSVPTSQLGAYAVYPNQTVSQNSSFGVPANDSIRHLSPNNDPVTISGHQHMTVSHPGVGYNASVGTTQPASVYTTSSVTFPQPVTGSNISPSSASQPGLVYNAATGFHPQAGTGYSNAQFPIQPVMGHSSVPVANQSGTVYSSGLTSTTQAGSGYTTAPASTIQPNYGYGASAFVPQSGIQYNASSAAGSNTVAGYSTTSTFVSQPGTGMPTSSTGSVPYQVPHQPYIATTVISADRNSQYSLPHGSVTNVGQTNQQGIVHPSSVSGSKTVGGYPFDQVPQSLPLTNSHSFSTAYSSQATSQLDTRTNTFNSLNGNSLPNTLGIMNSTGKYQVENSSHFALSSNSSIPQSPFYSPGFASSTQIQNTGLHVPTSNYHGSSPVMQVQGVPSASVISPGYSASPVGIPHASNVYTTSIVNNPSVSSQLQNFSSSNTSFVQPSVRATSLQQNVPNQIPVQQYSNMPYSQHVSNTQQNINVAYGAQHPNVSTIQSNPSSMINFQQSVANSLPQQVATVSPIQQHPSNVTFAQQNPSVLMQQGNSMQFIQNDILSSGMNLSSNVSSLSQVSVNEQTYNAQGTYNAVGNVMNQNSLPNQQLLPPMQPLSQAPVSNEPSVNVVVSKEYVADRRPSSTPLDSNPKLSIARDFITPPPESLCTRSGSSEIKLDSSTPILQPKVLDLKSIVQTKEKEQTYLAKDPLDDPSVRTKFVSEVEKYEKLVEGLVRKSLNGTTPLDQKWKELTDAQDKESRKLSISVARCYPLKNRFPDVMPYDSNRVSLSSAKDDYINASYLKDICSSSPVFILTQSPLPATFVDFWTMVWEQQVETLLCMLPDSELKNHLYFPKEKGQVLTFGFYEVSLHSYKEKTGFTERMINLTQIKNRMSKVVVHLQFTLWPASGIPSSPALVLQFITDVLNYQKQQRNLLRPVVVHCSAGIGRSACLCLITALVTDMNYGHGPKDVAQVAANLSQQRKFLIQDKDQLKFCYDTVLYYAQDLLMKRGILTSRASFDDKLPGCGSSSTHVRHPSEDFIMGGGGLAKLQSDMVKMGLADSTEPPAKPADTPKSECAVEGGDTAANGSSIESKEESDPSITEEQQKPESAEKSLSSITSLLDPSNFTLDSSSPGKRKITKEAFTNSKGSLSASSIDSADPLSQLDPLWSLKKK